MHISDFTTRLNPGGYLPLVCRLCQSAKPSNCSVQQKLSSRFSDLLDVSAESSDDLSQYVCCKCKRRLEILENAVQDLFDFSMSTYSAVLASGTLKESGERLESH